jgi:hypothetical protein
VRHVRMLGLCLLAMCAFGAIVASGASAHLPEWGGCEAKAEGKYEDAACTVKAHKSHGVYTGGYEWYAGASFGKGYGIDEYFFEVQFSPTSFEATGGKTIQCSGGTGYMELESPSSVKEILYELSGCKSEGQPCKSPFVVGGPGSITNETQWLEGEGLKGKLGYVAGKGTETPTIGLTLTAFRTPKQLKEEGSLQKVERLLQADCEGPIGTVYIGGQKKGGNALISVIAPVDEMSSEYTQTFAGTAGVPSPLSFEGRKETYLQESFSNTGTSEQSAWNSTVTLVPEGPPIEIKAIP